MSGSWRQTSFCPRNPSEETGCRNGSKGCLPLWPVLGQRRECFLLPFPCPTGPQSPQEGPPPVAPPKGVPRPLCQLCRKPLCFQSSQNLKAGVGVRVRVHLLCARPWETRDSACGCLLGPSGRDLEGTKLPRRPTTAHSASGSTYIPAASRCSFWVHPLHLFEGQRPPQVPGRGRNCSGRGEWGAVGVAALPEAAEGDGTGDPPRICAPTPVGVPLVLNACIFFTFPPPRSPRASCSAWWGTSAFLGVRSLRRGSWTRDSWAQGPPYGGGGRSSACAAAAGGGAEPVLCPQV